MNDESIIGIFLGLESSSNEYVAQLIAPYRHDFELELGSLIMILGIREKLIARVMDYVPRGEFTSFMGEKWLNEIAAQGAIDEVGSDIKKSKISYKVRIKILGSLSEDGDEFVPGLKKIPHITSKVSIPDEPILEKIIGKALEEQCDGIEIGRYTLNDKIPINFRLAELNAKRTFVFARAGYGKSNLMKVISSSWKEENGGLSIFDPEGEYAITDRKGRPGIMDRRVALLITNQKVDPGLKNVYRNIKLDLTTLPYSLVIPLLVNTSKHETVFFAKLMAMNQESWSELVKLLFGEGWMASYDAVHSIVLGDRAKEMDNASEVDVKPILNNLVRPIRQLHDQNSRMLPIIEKALRSGKVVIFDISRIDSQTARFVSSIIVKKIFDDNKDNFIKFGGDDLIKATFVLEEAHTVLSAPSSAPSAFVDLAKEGRKYSMGGIFITQQPGSIPHEIISQGDNFFVFHLLSKGDLSSLSKANANYSNDIITQVLNEPIRGKSYMWTSHQPFVIPINVLNFEDPEFTKPNQSSEIQEEHDILGTIEASIVAELNNPTLKSILEKVSQIESEMRGMEEGQKTIRLFQNLTNEERSYLDKQRGIQIGPQNGKPFAVTFPCYRGLVKDARLSKNDISEES